MIAPRGFALAGDHLFVADYGNGKVGEYSASTGAAINASFIQFSNSPSGLALLDDRLFVASFAQGNIEEYSVTTGSLTHHKVVTGLFNPRSLAVSIPAPEPGSAAFALLGGLGLLARRRR